MAAQRLDSDAFRSDPSSHFPLETSGHEGTTVPKSDAAHASLGCVSRSSGGHELRTGGLIPKQHAQRTAQSGATPGSAELRRPAKSAKFWSGFGAGPCRVFSTQQSSGPVLGPTSGPVMGRAWLQISPNSAETNRRCSTQIGPKTVPNQAGNNWHDAHKPLHLDAEQCWTSVDELDHAPNLCETVRPRFLVHEREEGIRTCVGAATKVCRTRAPSGPGRN